MITKLIQKIKQVLRKPIQVLIEPKDPSPHKTVPAPLFPPFDSWFGHAPKSEKTQEILKKEEESKKCSTCKCGKEVDNIHEVMYNMSTASGSTTVQLDPIGGSENVWQSGAGPHF